jgi:8-oxo-dGTP diphosphatase/2-hydroxy-dATP diphosphatase
VEEGESFEAGARRELEEESSVRAVSLKKRGYIVFHMEERMKLMKVHVYDTWEFDGTPIESDEMRPQWFNETDIPLDDMWPDDQYWLPDLLANDKTFTARYNYCNFCNSLIALQYL